jgi:hypothetical protein
VSKASHSRCRSARMARPQAVSRQRRGRNRGSPTQTRWRAYAIVKDWSSAVGLGEFARRREHAFIAEKFLRLLPARRMLLKDVLNPATHGDALVSAMRIGSTTAQGKNWAQYLSGLMNDLMHSL